MIKENETKLKVDRGIWVQMFHYFSEFKKDFIILCFFMITLAATDIAFPLLTRYAIDEYVANKNLEGLTLIAVIFLILAIFLSLTVLLFIRRAGKIETMLEYKMREDGFEKLQKLSFRYYDENAVGWMIARITSDAKKISETLAWSVVDLVWGGTMMLGITIVMLIINWKLALITLITIPFLALLSLFFEKRMLSSYRGVRKINSLITGLFNDGIVGAKTTKTLVREELNIEEFTDVTQRMSRVSVRAATLSSAYLPLTLFVSAVGTVFTLYFGSAQVLSSVMTFGTLVLFITYARQFFDPIVELARIYTEMISAQAACERVLGLLGEKEDISDHEVDEKLMEIPIKGDVTFSHVDFYYIEGEYILKDFNLDIKAGQTIALVGETGSGKSTIVNLACRFYEPTKGEILIDGIDYRKRTQHFLHQNIGYVLQAPHLFSGTIKENILYGKLDATDEEVIEAAKIVDAHDFIMRLEFGYDTPVGEGGGMLSTGEKQLVSFARAIIAKPSLFFLDEATSSIDTESEAKIQKAINEVLKGRTSFIVAHRLSTIKNADQILVIDEGKILEQGTHDELLKAKGHYFELYTNQFQEEASQEILGKKKEKLTS
ncbi:MAG: ABC transporter ATP-binding protein [Clostridium sp.]|jgi:ATP-binding cassette subfamily B protein|nr:ABC transporter ATP-binding protein [Clostridium sp.]